MGIEFSWLNQGQNQKAIILDHKTFTTISPALEQLGKKTGIYLDPYASSRISPDHASLLVTLLINAGLENEIKGKGFIKMLKESVQDGKWILVEGD